MPRWSHLSICHSIECDQWHFECIGSATGWINQFSQSIGIAHPTPFPSMSLSLLISTQCHCIVIYMIVALRLKLFSSCLGLQYTIRLVASHRSIAMQTCFHIVTALNIKRHCIKMHCSSVFSMCLHVCDACRMSYVWKGMFFPVCCWITFWHCIRLVNIGILGTKCSCRMKLMQFCTKCNKMKEAKAYGTRAKNST